MTPQFLIDLIGDEETARRVTQIILIILILFVPLSMRWLARFFLRPLSRFTKRILGEELGERITKGLMPPAQFLIVIASFYVALSLITLELSDTLQNVVDQSVTVLLLIGVFWGLYRTVDVVTLYLQRQAWVREGKLVDSNLVRFANQIAEALVVIFGFVVIMDEIGYNLNGVLAGLGLGGLAVALAAQEAIKDLIGYAAIMTDEPFEIGDFVEVAGLSGVIESVGFRSTKVRQLDQAQAIIPNNKVANSVIKNWSRLSKRRFDITLGLHYETSPEQIRAVSAAIDDLLIQSDMVIHDGSEFAQFIEFGDSSINMRIISYLSTPDWAEFQHQKADLQMQVIDILEAHGVRRALPTRSFVINPATEDLLTSAESASAGAGGGNQ